MLSQLLRRELIESVEQLHASISSGSFAHESNRLSASLQMSRAGLFGLDSLHTSDDYVKVGRAMLQRCQRLLSPLLAAYENENELPDTDIMTPLLCRRLFESKQTSLLKGNISTASSSSSVSACRLEWPQLILKIVDDTSRMLCTVADSAALCRSTHSDARWRESSQRAWNLISEYMYSLNASRALYCALHDAVVARGRWALDAQDVRMGESMLAELASGGVHLSGERRARVVDLHARIGDAAHRFNVNAHMPPGSPTVAVSTDEARRWLPGSLLRSVDWHLDAESGGTRMALPLDQRVVGTVMQRVPCGNMRRRVFLAQQAAGAENVRVLNGLLDGRNALARELGFDSCAEHMLGERMASSVGEVDGFLRALHAQLEPDVRDELALLRDAKRRNKHDGGTGRLQPWDRAYYMGVVQQREHSALAAAAMRCFSLADCLRGLHIVVSALFGLRLRVEPLAPAEHCVDDDHDDDHAPIIKLEVVDADADGGDTLLGVVYLDLFAREHKHATTATYAVQFPGDEPGQIAIATVVANIHAASRSAAATATATLLSLADAETLWHEFAHALHIVLSGTRYQHMSGTRCALDFVETPSTLMERFFWDERVMRLFARDYETHAPIDDESMQRLRRSRSRFAALDAEHQVFLSLVDMHYHSARSRNESTEQILQQLQSQYSSFPFVKGINSSQFTHLTGYAAGYYSYLACRIVSSQIWRHHFVDDPLSRHSGERLRRDFLAHGGSVEPNELLRRYIPDSPSPFQNPPSLLNCD
jgi:mitochondrial intermediate peptidase